MELYLTRHARNRMRLYDITPEEIRETLTSPDHITIGAFESRHAWKRRQKGWLRVTFKDEGRHRIVITATPKHHWTSEGETHAH